MDDQDKYDNWLAKFLAWCNLAPNWAITLKQCTRYSHPKDYVDERPAWRKHEDCHKRQWASEGTWRFARRYVWQLLTKGYLQIDYEVAARAAEKLP